jgi:hypothetical protein
MNKITSVIVALFLVLAVPVTAQFYRYIDKDGNLRFTDDLNRVPVEQRTRASEYKGFKPVSPALPEDTPPAEKQEIKPKTTVPDPAVIGSVVQSAPQATVSLGDLRAQIEKMKSHLDLEYQALTQEREDLAKNREQVKTIEEIALSNKLVDAFNQRAEKYEKTSEQLRNLVVEYNTLVFEKNTKMKLSK